MKTTTSKRIALALSNIITPIAVLVFATGFFPYKPFLSGLATFEEVENEELGLGLLKGNDRPQRIFDKVIFMTVDALRRWVRSPWTHTIKSRLLTASQ
jgi:ethanolaminephosphotransferase